MHDTVHHLNPTVKFTRNEKRMKKKLKHERFFFFKQYRNHRLCMSELHFSPQLANGSTKAQTRVASIYFPPFDNRCFLQVYVVPSCHWQIISPRTSIYGSAGLARLWSVGSPVAAALLSDRGNGQSIRYNKSLGHSYSLLCY